MQFHDVAAHPERAALEIHVVARVLQINQAAKHVIAIRRLALADRQHRLLIINRRAEPENAGDRCDEQHIVATDQVAGCAQPQAVEVVVS